jgi:hypothetical protein
MDLLDEVEIVVELEATGASPEVGEGGGGVSSSKLNP